VAWQVERPTARTKWSTNHPTDRPFCLPLAPPPPQARFTKNHVAMKCYGLGLGLDTFRWASFPGLSGERERDQGEREREQGERERGGEREAQRERERAGREADGDV
jgi:hypothetical protein